jgi:hypothetical protein
MNQATSWCASALVAKRLRLSTSNTRVECQLSTAALSKQDPTRPIDRATPRRSQTPEKREAAYSEPLSVWNLDREDDRFAKPSRQTGHGAAT